MERIEYVKNSAELKAALEGKADFIVITDKDLASHISTIKAASRLAFVTAIAAAGVGVIMWWNPIGYLADVVVGGVAIANTTLIVAIVSIGLVLGATVLYALYKDYRVVGKGKVRYKGVTIEGELGLEHK